MTNAKDKRLTKEDFEEFLNAKSYNEKLEILTKHSKINRLNLINKGENMNEIIKTDDQIKQELETLNSQFTEFLQTKGIKAKFKLAFSNMKESAKAQREKDKAQFAEIKAKSAEENKDFVEFLHTKGFKAKCRLIIENIKKGAKESKAKTAENIAKVKAQTAKNIANTNPYANKKEANDPNGKELSIMFNEFLTEKGLDGEYKVIIENK